MARTPTPMDITLPGVQGARPVAGYDVSAFGAGGAALARGGERMGQGIEQGAADIAAKQTEQARQQHNIATSKALAEKAELDAQFIGDVGFEDLADRRKAASEAITSKWATTIPNGPIKENFLATQEEHDTKQHVKGIEQAFKGKASTALANVDQDYGTLIRDMPRMSEADASARIDAHNRLLEDMGTNGYLTPDQVQLKKTAHGEGIALRHEDTEMRNNPKEYWEKYGGAQATFDFLHQRGINTRTEGLNPDFALRLKTAIADAERATGERTRIESLKRTTAEQAELYRRYQTGQGGLAAPPGQSRHEIGNAADISDGKVLAWLHANADQYGLEFLKGRAFENDSGHIQLKGGGTAAPRMSPDDAFARNAEWLKPAKSYDTDLGKQEPDFQKWVADNKVPFDTNAKGPQDYDMRGFWKALQAGDKRATSAIDPNDGKMHYPDYWKTPYHETFSNESRWATKDAPRWNDKDQLVDKGGKVVFDDRVQNQRSAPRSMRDLIDPLKLDRLVNQARILSHREETEARAGFAKSLTDDYTEAGHTGAVTRLKTLDDFVTAGFDNEEAAQHFAQYRATVQMYGDRLRMASMSPPEREALIASYTPQPGGPPGSYASQQQRQDELAKVDKVIREAAAAADKVERRKAIEGFQERVKDATMEAVRTGAAASSIPRSDFIDYLGEDKGGEAWRTYTRSLQFGADASAMMRDMSAEDRAGMVGTWTPQPGEPGYAEKARFQDEILRVNKSIEDAHAAVAKRQDDMAKAAEALARERDHDPAAYTIKYLPAVSDAWSKLEDAQQPGQAAIDPAAAARDYALKTQIEQQRMGIAPDEMSLVPKSYVEHFTKTIAAAAGSDDPQARIGLIAKIQKEAATWGDNWPAVMRQMAPGAQPIARAIAAGADPVAMTRLLSVPKDENPAKVLKEQSETTHKQLTTALNTAFTPFRSTLVGRQMDRDFPGYYGLGEKLGALYVRDGDSAEAAATKAFNALIGNRYEFRDTWRMPKSAGVSADDVQAGSEAARHVLRQGTLGVDVAPAVNDIGLADNTADSLAKFARDGKWITSHDNGGLNLVYDDKFVRTKAGAPLFLSWDDLAKRGTGAASERRNAPPAWTVPWQ